MSKKIGHFGYDIKFINHEGIQNNMNKCLLRVDIGLGFVFGNILCFNLGVVSVSCIGHEEMIKVVVKSKTTAIETCNMLNKMAQACGLGLAIQFQKYKLMLGFR